jgi:8-oxo-dGTP diphosphatase
VIREVREESGLRITKPRFHGFLTFPVLTARTIGTCGCSRRTAFTGRLRESAEGVLRWIPNAAVPRLPLWEGDRIFLKWLKKKRTFLGTFSYRKGRLASHRVSFY